MPGMIRRSNQRKINKKPEDYRPMNDFYINSSHNTYLTGHQFYGSSSDLMYKLAMDIGCRLVELDCYDGSGTDIKVTHGYAIVGKLKGKDVLQVLRQNAFLNSPYPVILSIENHLSKKYQDIMANDIRQILKDVFILNEDNLPVNLPDLKEMKNKFIIKFGGSRPKGPIRKNLPKRSEIIYEEVEEQPLNNAEILLFFFKQMQLIQKKMTWLLVKKSRSC